MPNTVARGSSVSLFFGEELQYGKPNWDYAGSPKTVSAAQAPGDKTVTVNNTSSLANGDLVAIYVGDYAGVVQLAKIRSISSNVITLVDETPLQFAISSGARLEKVNDLKEEQIRLLPGVKTISLAVEQGEIPSEALKGASDGQRVRAQTRKGAVSGEGGNFVTEVGIADFVPLLRHAVGSKVYYNAFAQSESPTVSTTLSGSNNDKGDTSITVAANTGIDVGDRIKIGTGDTAEIGKVSAKASTTGLTLEQGLERDHNSGTTVIVVNGVQTAELRKADLPEGFTLYQYHEDLDTMYIVTGCKVGSFELSASNDDSMVQCTVNTVAKAAQQVGDNMFATTPTGSTHTPYTSLELALFKGSERERALTSLTINGDNEVTSTITLDGSGTAGSAPEGTGIWTSEIEYQLFDTDFFTDAIEENTAEWKAVLQYSAAGEDGEKIEFVFPDGTVTGNIIPAVDQGAGLTASATIRAGYSSAKKTNFYVNVASDHGRLLAS